MTTEKNIPLTIQTFLSKIMALPLLCLKFFKLFILIGGYLLYNIVVGFTIYDTNQLWVYMCPAS